MRNKTFCNAFRLHTGISFNFTIKSTRVPQTHSNPAMSYEKHVNMIINCMSGCAFGYIAAQMIAVNILILTSAAELVKPACPYTLLFHAVLASLMFVSVQNGLVFIQRIAFLDVASAKASQPDMEVTVAIPATGDMLRFVSNEGINADGVAKIILALKQQVNKTSESESDKKEASNDTASTPESASAIKTPTTPASECSQADTEICKAAKE